MQRPHRKQNPILAVIALILIVAMTVTTISPWKRADIKVEAAPAADRTVAEPENADESESAPEPEAKAEAEPAAVPVMAEGTVSFPGGVEVDVQAKNVSLTNLSSADVDTAANLLGTMPRVCVVDLGNTNISVDDLAKLRSSAPDARFIYSFDYMGQSVNMRTETLSLVGLGHNDVQNAATMLSCLPELKMVDLGDGSSSPELSWEDIGILEKAAPNAVFDYNYSLCGKEFSTADGVINLSHVAMNDGGAAVREVLPYVYSKFLDMDTCGVGDVQMAAIRDENPDIKVVWRVWFGPNDSYTVRTDTTRILASKPSVAGELRAGNVDPLIYCTDVKYLDIGHNERLETGYFIGYMPHLTAVILAMTEIDDISMFANCPHLEYVEIFTMKNLSDISVLSQLKELKHLAIMHNPSLKDISPIMDLDLYRLWIGPDNEFPDSQIEEFAAKHPYCELDLTTVSDQMGTWRYTKFDVETGVYTWSPRYKFLRDQMGYSMLLYSFDYNDPRA